MCTSDSPGRILGCAYTICFWSNLLHNSQGTTFSTQSYLLLYSFCTNLLHLLIIWLISSFLSLHNLHLLFCCVLSILVWKELVLMASSCAAIRRDSVSFSGFPFLNHVQVFSCENSLACRFKFPYSFFFRCLLSSYFCSVDVCVAWIVSGGCNQSSPVLFYVVFVALYQCIDAILNTSEFSFSLFSWYIDSALSFGYKALCIISFSCSLIIIPCGL